MFSLAVGLTGLALIGWLPWGAYFVMILAAWAIDEARTARLIEASARRLAQRRAARRRGLPR